MKRTVVGTEVSFKRDDTEIKAYQASPERDRNGAGLIVFPDVHGLSEHYRDVARRLAAEGFTALAIDPYSREGTPKLGDLEEVFAWMKALPDQRILADVAAAADHLAAQPGVDANAIGITGFCMGGQYTLMAACTIDRIATAVSWYGMLRYDQTNDLKPASPLDLAPKLKCPYLGLFGAEDPIIPTADVEELRSTLERANKTFEIEIYQGAGHAFFNDTREAMYRPEVAKKAWPRAIAFLKSNLCSA